MLLAVRRRGFYILAALLLSLTAGATRADDSNWPQNILTAMKAHSLPSDTLAMAAVPLDGPGKPRFVDADQLMSPGSTMKLLTTYAALELLGPNFQWNTRLYTDGKVRNGVLDGNLYFVGVGDPKLTQERLWMLLRDLRAYGIHDIHGDLVLDGSYFHLPDGLPRFPDDGGDPHAPYLVQPSALLTNLNVFHFQIAARTGGQVHAWVEPDIPQLTLNDEVVLTGPGPCPSDSRFQYQPSYGKDGRITVTISGRLPKGCRSGSYLSLMKPEQYTPALIRSLWTGLGGTISGVNRLGTLPEGARLLVSTTSPELATMVRDTNKWSNNTMARQLFLDIGAENRLAGDKDDLAAARRTVNDWLTLKGIDTKQVVLDNGSGLSRSARISPRQQVKLLRQAWRSPYAAELISSLPLVAMDGTMKHRLRDTDVRGEGHVKTGSLTGVRAIAGFTRDRDGTTWAVSAIVNSPGAWKSQPVLDAVLQAVHDLPTDNGTEISQASETPAPRRTIPGG